MPINITMPALSPTMEEGTLAKWRVKEGDSIGSGDVIAEIETDKATMEVEAVDEGVVAKILVAEGSEGVKVNAVIAVLAEDGEDPASVTAPSDATSEAPKITPAPAADPALSPIAESPKPTPPMPKAVETHAANVTGRIFASPLAKRIAAQKSVDLTAITGTGPRGRIVVRDVENAQPGASTSAASTSISVPVDGLIMPQVLDDRVYEPDSYELVPLDGVRRTVARRLTESFMQVPHFPLNIDVQLDRLLTARAGINSSAPEGVKISVNDMLIKASALALMDEPDCNASYTDNGIAFHKSANISVAVAIDGGLITPVIRNAQSKGLAEISREMKDLATRARERKLKPQEYMGGTFSISNLGMFGIKSFGSIINPPEGMILSVGAGEKRPIVNDKNEIDIATILSLTLTCDHRVIGGAEGAKWLQAFKRYVESPESMLL